MFGLLGFAAIIGAAIWTKDLYEGYAGVKQMASIYGSWISNNPEIQSELMKHTLGVVALWIFGIGSVIYHFAPTSPADKPADTPTVSPTVPVAAPVVTETVAHDTRECPHCAEIIKAAAKLCRYCQSTVEPVSKAPVASLVQTPVAAPKAPNPADFTWSVGGTTLNKPINNPSGSRNAFSHFARRH